MPQRLQDVDPQLAKRIRKKLRVYSRDDGHVQVHCWKSRESAVIRRLMRDVAPAIREILDRDANFNKVIPALKYRFQ